MDSEKPRTWEEMRRSIAERLVRRSGHDVDDAVELLHKAYDASL